MKAYQGMVPPVPYFGAKGKMAPLIAALLPKHKHYVEPYGGSLAVLFAKPPSIMETVNDLDGQLMTFWRVVRDRFPEFEWLCITTPHARAEMDLLPSEVDDELEVARRVWSRLTQGRLGKMDGNATNWRYRVDTSVGPIQDYLDRGIDRLPSAAQRLRRVSIENLPALDIIGKYGRNSDVCLYVDPPYLGGTRDNDSVYRYEMATEDEHRELAQALSDVDAAAVVSGYRSELYDELYAGWYTEEWATSTTQGGQGKATCEVLWSNRPLGNRVQLSLFDELQ